MCIQPCLSTGMLVGLTTFGSDTPATVPLFPCTHRLTSQTSRWFQQGGSWEAAAFHSVLASPSSEQM